MRKIFLASIIAAASQVTNAYEANELKGTWCFYEQEAAGNVAAENVTITLQKDGSYKWVDSFWKQDGTWSVEDNKLIMSNVGSHKLLSVTPSNVEMVRGSTMRMRKGPCQ
ncbi:hypothetical protein BTJ40_05680 [Microbulbifer sp. A4B17]|uniref:lipocalin-like domain-containing protein n=1 Tax=Microbulbifer sp. A4B17 TaxID=359370 RepID=UPI000D52EFD7|nr:glycoside hydrolase family 43 C-terminal domain-containing protein [Microbulbifer sp. A4B17]AWF80338.1 hypothetical protein BTJ40_05680 [Microbulbifer sp. A4B17]